MSNRCKKAYAKANDLLGMSTHSSFSKSKIAAAAAAETHRHSILSTEMPSFERQTFHSNVLPGDPRWNGD